MRERRRMTSERTYLQTHPWLTFSADLRKASPMLWIMLGECQSKCECISGSAIYPAIARQISQVSLAQGAHATAAISGNTLSPEEVYSYLEGTLDLPPSRKYLLREIDNFTAGCALITMGIKGKESEKLTADEICGLNRIILADLITEDNAVPGEFRTRPAMVGSYQGAPEGDCEHLLGRLCEWLNGPGFSGGEGRNIVNAIIRAAFAHLYIAWIHPFGDGNGRTARLLEYQILVSAGVPSPSAHLLGVHYNLTRDEYFRQLELVGISGDVISFIQYAAQGFLDGLRGQLARIREEQSDLVWRNHVREFFVDTPSDSDMRRYHLVLDLASRHDPVPLSGIPFITPRLARAYAKKVERTLIRDLNFVIGKGLVEKTAAGYRAKREVVWGFMKDK